MKRAYMVGVLVAFAVGPIRAQPERYLRGVGTRVESRMGEAVQAAGAMDLVEAAAHLAGTDKQGQAGASRGCFALTGGASFSGILPVWLNNGRITSMPLSSGPRPMRHGFGLGPGRCTIGRRGVP